MGKTLILTAAAILPAFGCCDGLETLRRVEVWKAQNLFAPAQPVVVAPGGCSPCGAAPVATAPACSCQNGAAVTALVTDIPMESMPVTTGSAVAVPGTITTGVTAGYPPDAIESSSTEELDGVLKQP
jgi:hypothetical protein